MKAASEAAATGTRVYLVGGAVRDLLLGFAHIDIDLVVVGDAGSLARTVARRFGARVLVHDRFGTATVSLGGLELDLATARREEYVRPGALPLVSPAASIEEDLARRDFSINAMAIDLTAGSAGGLIDPFRGRDDLRERRVRVLHDASFQDDPTRMLRAVRYAGRLSFRLERRTARLLRCDIPYVNLLSGTRVRSELERICSEPRAHRIVALIRRTGLLSTLQPPVDISRRQQEAIRRAHNASGVEAPAPVCITLMLGGAGTAKTKALAARLSLTRRQAEAVRGLNSLLVLEPKLGRVSIRRSEIVAQLDRAPLVSVEAFLLLAERAVVRDRVRRYLRSWRSVRPLVRGRDIEGLGVEPGPNIGLLLRQLKAARLDGVVKTRQDEVDFVRGRQHNEVARG